MLPHYDSLAKPNLIIVFFFFVLIFDIHLEKNERTFGLTQPEVIADTNLRWAMIIH